MQSLRLRFVLVVVLAAVGPVVAVGYWARGSIVERTKAEHVRNLNATVDAVSRRVGDLMASDRRAVNRLCEHDFVIDRLILQMATGHFDDRAEESLVQLLPPLMRSLNLDVLTVFDARPDRGGMLLAAGHFPGLAGSRDPGLLSAIERAGVSPFVQTVRLRDATGNRDARALMSACITDRDGARLAVVGGRELDDAFVADLLGESASVQLRLTAPADPSGSLGREVASFNDARGRLQSRIVALVDQGPLADQLRQLDRGFLVAGGIALVVAIGFGLLLSLGISRPLEELEDAATRVAAGDLESTIGVRGGGEVGRALGAFDRMTRELRSTRERLLRAERIAAWRDIARRIAHEIKNPLSPIQVSIETMRKTYAKKHPDFDEIFEESTLMILEEVERLKRIVTEFSQFARMPRPQPTELDIGEVLSHVVGMHQGRGDVDGGPTIHLSLGKTPVIKADREQLTQVFVNLVQNAVDAAQARHGEHGGEVEVQSRPLAGGVGVEITVSDDGPGIPLEQRARIFEPYFTTKTGGTGLGLAIVHRIVSDHGGEVELEESHLGGAQMIVVLPKEGPPPEADGSMTDAPFPLLQRRS